MNSKILSYIDSQDVRKYLQQIDYKFSVIEAAYVIYNSDSLSEEEKTNNLRAILVFYDDMEIMVGEQTRSAKEVINGCIDDCNNDINKVMIDIPVPFNCGDILYDRCCDMPFVYRGRVTDLEKNGRYLGSLRCDGAMGWLTERHFICSTTWFSENYFKLEYYRKPYIGMDRLLQVMSAMEMHLIDPYEASYLRELICGDETGKHLFSQIAMEENPIYKKILSGAAFFPRPKGICEIESISKYVRTSVKVKYETEEMYDALLKKADLVITNSMDVEKATLVTGVAVDYDEGANSIVVFVCNDPAMRIVEKANERGIKVALDKALARTFYAVSDSGTYVPMEIIDSVMKLALA